FCLRARPLREEIAAQQLRSRVSVEVFSPRIHVRRRRRSGVVRHLVEALFPGYLFARFDYAEQARHVLSTQGVTGVVAIGEQPRPVDDSVIDFLRQQVAVAKPGDGPAALSEGDWVRIVEGAFRDSEGRVVEVDPACDAVKLLLSVLGREVQISLSRSTLMPKEALEAPYPASLLAGRASEGTLHEAAAF